MKKFLILLAGSVMIIVLSGCGGSDDVIVEEPILETFFITDEFGEGVSGIIYECDSGTSGITNFEGAFMFDIEGDTCRFDFVYNDIQSDLYIEYDNDPDTDAGIDGIYYECIVDGVLSESGYSGPIGFITDSRMHDECTLFDIY